MAIDKIAVEGSGEYHMPIHLHTRRGLMATTTLAAGLSCALAAAPAAAQSISTPSIAVNDGDAAGGGLDPVDVNGIGQFVTDNGDGTVGLCTATLINPRTVIMAAHCVNERDAGAYGQGGTPAGVGFQNDTIPGIVDWLTDGYQSNPGDYFYNVNHVAYNPHSLDLGEANNFYQGDVALASFDRPAANVPTWTTLFSPLPTPDSIDDATGTGYHVTITGYGMSGTGTTGTVNQIDFRRRTAENMLGLLGSLDDVDSFLFGSPDGLPQNLYMIDFDDPKRGTIEQNPYDFNAFKDAATPHEGTIGPGDSGGPLIIDQAFGDQKTIIGVLSGSTRYFASQPPGSYGTTAFYQPLYLFWDWIAANNPYRYVSSKAGDANWNDPAHWVTDLDPAYRIVDANGNLVNGIPTTPGAGIDGSTPKFGQVCYQQAGTDICEDVGTGDFYVDGQPVSGSAQGAMTAGLSSGGPADVTVAALTDAAQGGAGGATASTADVQHLAAEPALPAPTLANGLPGATGFVPDDTDGDASTGGHPYYYDVTLAADGTTTLDTGATVDRLTIAGPDSNLDITADGTLISLIDTTQYGSTLTVDGTLISVGDYALLGGMLTGNGTVITPYLTSVTGVIAPGSLGTTGTLTLDTNLILSSGSTLAIDLDKGGSDVLAVKALPAAGIDGIADVGGRIVFTPVAGYLPRYGDEATFLTAEGGVMGTFDAGSTLSAILYPKLIYAPDSVSVKVMARPYASVVDAGSPVQLSYAHLLDRSRGNYARMSTLYGQLDLMPLDSLEATLEAMAPRTETTRTELGIMASDNMAGFYRDRLALARSGAVGGTLAMIGQPLELAALESGGLPLSPRVMSDAGTGMVTAPGVKLPSNVSAYIAGGYLNGHSRPMPSATAPEHDSLDGYYLALGGEVTNDVGGVVGLSLSYSDTSGDATAAQHAKGRLYQGTLYSAAGLGGFTISSQASAGLFATDTRRDFQVGTVAYDLHQHDQSLAASAEVDIGRDLGKPGGLIVTPKLGLRYTHLGFSKAAETGGDAALAVDRTSFDSLQGRAGVDLGGAMGAIEPRLHAAYVHDFNDEPTAFDATFVDGAGAPAPFALASTDKNWGELGGALRYDSDKVAFDVGVDTTIGRGDLDYQSYRGSVTLRF